MLYFNEVAVFVSLFHLYQCIIPIYFDSEQTCLPKVTTYLVFNVRTYILCDSIRMECTEYNTLCFTFFFCIKFICMQSSTLTTSNSFFYFCIELKFCAYYVGLINKDTYSNISTPRFNQFILFCCIFNYTFQTNNIKLDSENFIYIHQG